MIIKQQLINDMKEAMKAREAERLTTIRFLMAEIKNAEIDGGASDEAAVQKIVAGVVKKSRDAVAEFEAAGRNDLVDEEKGKIALMEKYLPAQLSDEELRALVKSALETAGDNPNQGQLIGAVMKQAAGRADGKRVQQIIGEVLVK